MHLSAEVALLLQRQDPAFARESVVKRGSVLIKGRHRALELSCLRVSYLCLRASPSDSEQLQARLVLTFSLDFDPSDPPRPPRR